jgi:hypothetical protein
MFPTEVIESNPNPVIDAPPGSLELTATDASQPRVQGPSDATLTYVQPDGSMTVPDAPAAPSYQTGRLDPANMPATLDPEPWSPSQPETAESQPDAATAAILARPRSRGGWHIALIIIPLISYAILASIAAGILWFRQHKEPPHQLETLPDIEGEFPTNLKGNKREVISKLQQRGDKIYPKYDTPLPDHLKVRLGQTIKLGELEVTPLGLRQEAITMKERGKTQPYEPRGKALMLDLRLRNVSNDLPFHPLDRYFTRYYRAGRKRDSTRSPYSEVPYTYLEIGQKKYYGGPAGFYDTDLGTSGHYLNEYVENQEFTRLKPGEELETFICTDPEDDDLQRALDAHKGPLMWRVQVRRGSIVYADRRIPVTAVIGVEFTDEDYRKPRG